MIYFSDFGPGGGGPPPGIFTSDQLTPKWLADGSPSTLIVANGTGGDWDLHIREIGNVIDEGTPGAQRYKLTYTGHNVAVASYLDSTTTHIGWAYSSDGTSWTKGGELITARSLEDPFLIKVGSTYYLYVEDKADTPFRNMRLYTSTDFATWTDQGDILDKGTAGQWDDQDVSSPVVWREGSTWKMLYEGRQASGHQGKVGLATSSDGITWTKDPANPVFEDADIGWATNIVPDDLMIADDGTYVMLYHGFLTSKFRGAVAYSTDLYTWTDPLQNRSTRLDSSIFDHFTIQFHPVGTDMHFIYNRDEGTGIRQGDDMGYEVLVSNFTGANGSTTFTDESAWGHALTANGNAQVQSNKLELDGTGDYLSAADCSEWFLGDLPYTVEFFGLAFDSNTALMTLLSHWTTSNPSRAYRFDYRGDLSPDILRILARASGGQFFDDSSSWTPTVSTAYNVCFERSGTDLRFYINGTMLNKTTQSETFIDSAGLLMIGANADLGTPINFLDGRIDAFRFTIGKALYANDAGYSVPSLPLVPSN